MKPNLFLLILFSFSTVYAQEQNFTQQNIAINKFIDGILLSTNQSDKPNLAILIAGSGPTDRDGNQNFLKNNALKKLAEALTKNGIATYRYDKRIVKQIRQGYVDNNIMFDDFVTDATSVINYFKNKDSYNKIYVIGHSQGSLVGMLTAKDKVNGFISLAGAGQSIDKVIIDQIDKTAPMFSEEAKKTFNVLKQGSTTDNFPPALASIFRKDIQPFMMNWMQYDPQKIIAELKIPVLILNGTKDLQVSVNEANVLKNALPSAKIKVIENMNHVLVPIEGGNLENSKSYNEAFRKISPDLIDYIVTFIQSNN